MKFEGTFTALVTPFQTNGAVDYQALEGLLEDQIAAEVEGVVILGTTGESPTICCGEYAEIIHFVRTKVDGRIMVLAGSGSNNTRKTIKQSLIAQDQGVDGLMIVNPYYNKPTQEGLYQHFWSVAEAVDLPQIIYNIEGRTGVNVETSTLVRLAQHKNIVAVKEASGNISQMMEVIAQTPDDFAVLSGDDLMTYSLIALGGNGVISVLSNIVPEQVKKMTELARKGYFEEARKRHYELLPLIRGCFLETNPIPVKTALVLQGKVQEAFRLPMCPMGAANQEKWKQTLVSEGLLEVSNK